MKQLDCLFIGAVMNYDGEVGSLANHIRQDGRWITPHQFIYQKRKQVFGSEARACVYDVPNLSISKLVDHLARTVDDFRFHIVWHLDYHRDEVLDVLRNDPPHLVAISTTLAFFPQFLNDAIAWINEHKRPETKVVIGGKWILDQFKLSGPTHKLESTLVQADPDYAVINDFGEETLRKLLLAMRRGREEEARSLDNIAWRLGDAGTSRDSGDEVPSPPAPREHSPRPAGDTGGGCHGAERRSYEGTAYRINPVVTEALTPGQPMIDFDNFGERFLSDTVHVRTCSSCPFKCKFCTFPVLQGEHVLFDLDAVMTQLRQLKRMGVRFLFFVDDTFNVPKRRFEDLMDLMIAADLGMQWVSFYRPQYANEELTRKMYDAGCRMVFCGFESGNDEILELMDKKVKVADYLHGLQYLNKAGIVSLASYIVGYPGETYETCMDTLALVDHPLVDFSRGSLFYYDTNAPVAAIADEWELTGYGAVWSHRTMDYKQAQGIHLEMVSRLKGINVPVSDGGAWSIFNLFARGLEWDEIKTLYREFNALQKQQIEEQGENATDGYRAYAAAASQLRNRRGGRRGRVRAGSAPGALPDLSQVSDG